MNVLITGGAGFLGRGILRRAKREGWNWNITVYSRDETKQELCRQRYPEARYVIGDVRDVDRLTDVVAGHDLVIHASAVKYIDVAEMNAAECVSVNVGGAEAIIKAVRRVGSNQITVIGISTDKAVSPVNVYGASKMVMERLFAEASREGQIFRCVRYGNVVGSTGSVIPIFQKQAAETGHVKITNPSMTRFWMSVDEAIDVILIATGQVPSLKDAGVTPGSVIVPMARAMNLIDVSKAVAPAAEIDIIGERPGEKVHEALISSEESVRVQRHFTPDFFELLPPGQRKGESPFTLSSRTPQYFMTAAEMKYYVEDAATI